MEYKIGDSITLSNSSMLQTVQRAHLSRHPTAPSGTTFIVQHIDYYGTDALYDCYCPQCYYTCMLYESEMKKLPPALPLKITSDTMIYKIG